MSRTLIYVAGPYSAPTKEGIEANIRKAEAVAQSLWKRGVAVICPHLNTAHFEIEGVTWEDYLDGDEEMILCCDGVLMLEGWENSAGAMREFDFAKSNNIPVYHDVCEIFPHPTTIRCPVQARAFRSEVMSMYRVHLDKNTDYSPANILGTGQIGVVTRLWDKMARLMNLMGFDLRLQNIAEYSAPKNPKHESIEDNLRDLSVYSVIFQLLRRGQWGK